jgi:P-type E1-E2 ATPase
MITRYFVVQDVCCYDEEADEPCQVRQVSLLDELGQVSHIFSDKTGTLTSNLMSFRRCYVCGVEYGAPTPARRP